MIANMSQIIQLSFLTEKEEESILSMIEEDLKLQKEEERRIQYVNHLTRCSYSRTHVRMCTAVGNYEMILQASC